MQTATAPNRREPGDDMPRALAGELDHLNEWAETNRKEAVRDRRRFWSLKAPAIIVSACTGVFAYVDLDPLTLAAGAAASAVVLLDGLIRPGALRDVHYLAYFELRSLQQDVASVWAHGVLLGYEDPRELAATLVLRIQQERKRIEAYLKEVEVGGIPTSERSVNTARTT